MGQGICAFIPITFEIDSSNKDAEYFPYGFFESYNQTEHNNSSERYTLKPEILIPNFKSFYTEFVNTVYNGNHDGLWLFSEWDGYDRMVDENSLTRFIEFFSEEKFGRYEPEYKGSWYYSVPYIDVHESIYFYRGSYKAYLEEEYKLLHVDRLLNRAIDNPLSKVAKFCIYG